jgi:hypothetical protein
MRRFILVFMMCLLPLQWSWAAAASVCAHEREQTHFGHHEHEHVDGQGAVQVQAGHDAPAPADAAQAADDQPPEAPGEHPDCHTCHGIGAACLARCEPAPAVWQGGSPPLAYGRALPEPPVDTLLRPPLAFRHLNG